MRIGYGLACQDLIDVLNKIRQPFNSNAIESIAKTALLIDLSTGEVLLDKNSEERTYPSSMTKIMTALMAFEKIKDGTLSMDQEFLISKKALEEILLSSNLELHKVIQEMSLELAKKSDLNLPISHEKLLELVEKSPTVIKALSLQLHHRLSERIY